MEWLKDGKFKNLIVDSYNKAKEGNMVGLLYGAISTYSFKDITDIDDFVNSCNPDMLHLKSLITDSEVDIYEWALENYKIENNENTIYVKTKNRAEVVVEF